MRNRKLKLDKALADSLVSYCEATLILPDDLVRVATNQKPKEPFLLDARQIGGRNETDRMIRILYTLWKAVPDSFDKAAAGISGHKRLWFSKDWRQISDTGSSNYCQRIRAHRLWALKQEVKPAAIPPKA
jgi:negative regulator of replication initiation